MMHGRIESGRYIVSVFGQEVALRTLHTGTDQWGPFAMVAQAEYPLAGGFTLAVDIEPDEDGFHGSVLTVFQRRGSWIDPESSFSVYFGPGESKDGSGTPYADRPQPWLEN